MRELKFRQEKVPLDKILLDPRNPRFLSKGIVKCSDKQIPNEKIQKNIRKKIMTEFQGKLLKDSIREVGFLKIDRIICRSFSVNGDDYYLIIEGNRRIAAAKELKDDIEEMKVDVDDSIVESIKEIEILVIEDDSEGNIWLIQGLRHISGIMEWKAYEKAQAMKNLYDLYDFSTRIVGEIIGQEPKEIANYLRALAVYMIARKDEEFGAIVKPDKWDFFAHLIASPAWRKWLKFKDATPLYKSKVGDLDNLKRFLSWIDNEDLVAGRELREVRKLLRHEDEGALSDFEEQGLIPTLEKHDEIKRKVVWQNKVKGAMKALTEMEIAEIKAAVKKPSQIKLLRDLKKLIEERLDDMAKLSKK